MRSARTHGRRARHAGWAALAAAVLVAVGAAPVGAAAPPAGKGAAPAAAEKAPSAEDTAPMVPSRVGLEQAKKQAGAQVQKATAASNAMAGMLSGQGAAAGTAGTPARPKPAATVKAKPAKAARSEHAVEEHHLMNREVYVYKTVGRRDPFASLLEGEFETTVGSPLLDVSSMKLVGIVWSASDKFALVEDGRGHGHVLRVGDPVINGYVVGLTRDELLVRQTSYGDSQTVTIQLQRKEGNSNEK